MKKFDFKKQCWKILGIKYTHTGEFWGVTRRTTQNWHNYATPKSARMILRFLTHYPQYTKVFLSLSQTIDRGPGRPPTIPKASGIKSGIRLRDLRVK